MSDTEEHKLKRKVKVFVVAAMSLLFVLVVVAVFQFAVIINNENTKNALKKQNEYLEQQINLVQNDELYYKSEQFKRNYLLSLGLGYLGDIIFI
jgi:flagellar basal body-associated protein FliL